MPDPSGRLAIVLHIFHLDIAERMLTQLSWLGERDFALWVTVPTERRTEVEALLDRHGLAAEVRDYDSTSMDVLPFLLVLPELVEYGYTAVVKLHTKRGEDSASAVWSGVLLDGMCREPVLGAIDRAFRQYPDLEMIGLAPFYLSARKLALHNETLVTALANDVPSLSEPTADWGFFAGTMFAARTEPLLPLAKWAEDNIPRFASAYQSDGLWEHALELVFCLMACKKSLSIGLIHGAADSAHLALQRVHIGEGISQAHSCELSSQIEFLKKDCAYLMQCDLLDKANYTLEGELVGEIDLYRHYLLIGQFDHRVSASKAWSLKRHNDRQLPWDRWSAAPREPDLVSVIIPVFNQPELTEQCIRALFASKTTVRFEVVCVDNGSEAATGALLAQLAHEFSGLRLVSHETNLNFALGCNTGFGRSQGARVVFLNNDTTVTDGWLDGLMARLDKGDCFAVQPQLRYPDGTLQCMGVVFSEKSVLGYPIYAKMAPEECEADKPRMFKALTAACLALKASDFADMKGFDALYINGQEDVDLCLRLHEHTGKLGAYVPDSVVVHHESKSEGRYKQVDKNRMVFAHRWKARVSKDDISHYCNDGFRVVSWNGDAHSPESGIRVYRPVLEALPQEQMNADLHARRAVLRQAASEALLSPDSSEAVPSFVQEARLGGVFPELSEFWLDLSRRRWLSARGRRAAHKVGVCSWCLSDNAAGRAVTLAEAYAPHTEVEVIGCIVPNFGEALWGPIQPSSIPCHYFTVSRNIDFVRQALGLVIQHPYDIVHLSKPRIHNVIFGWLYQLVWGARVIMDVDDEELAFVKADGALNPFEYIRTHGSLPPLSRLRSKECTQLAVGMVDQFDGVTVSNPALQRRYGGQVIPHVRPLARFEVSAARRAASRERFGVPAGKTVVLFFGTPRRHKGVAETARALASLNRNDLCYVVAGGHPDTELQAELDAISGLPIVYLGPQPYEQAADVVALGDVCVLLQEADSLAAQYQLPAKLVDALGMGLTVFAQVTPALAHLAEKGAFIPVTRENLVEQLGAYFEAKDPAQGERGRAVFEAELTVEALVPTIKAILNARTPRRARSLSWHGQVQQVIHKGQLPLGVPLAPDVE